MFGKDKVHRDPVCGMDVDEKNAADTSRFDGKKYYFCSKDCKDKFDLQPERYAESVVPKS